MSVSQRENQAQLESLKQEHERRMERIRDDNRRREEEARQAGAATVNHIKKSTTQQVDQLREESAQKLRAVADQANRNYNELRRRTQQNYETIESQARTAEENSHRRINSAHRNEAHVMEQTNEKLREFLARQEDLKVQARENANKNIDELRRESHQQLMQTKAQASEKLREFDTRSKEQLSELRDRNKAVYEETKAQADRRVAEALKDTEIRVVRDREQKNDSLRKTAIKYREAANTEQRSGEQRLAELKKQNMDRLEKLVRQDLERNEKVQAEYASESQRIQEEGESDINARQEKFDKLREKQQAKNQARLNDLELDYKTKETKLLKDSEARLQHEATKLDQSLQEQRSDFKERFDLNDKTFKGSLQNQKENYLKALYKQKQKYDNHYGRESARAEDPFYRLKSFEARLNENPHSYELKAKVAPYDKDSVNIVVKDDKITVTAHRSFEDKFATDNGAQTSTNSYQTYRQDFKLAIPVEGKLAVRKIDDDGTITVIAPKKGHKTKV